MLRSSAGWATAADGAHLAYASSGAGPTLLYLSEGFLPVDCMAAEPGLAHCLRRLSLSFRLLRFDRRGVGRSDPVSPLHPPTLEQAADDAVRVLDAAQEARAVVFAPADAGLVGITLAARAPDRVAALVLVNAFPQLHASDDHPVGLPRDFVASARERATTPGHPSGPFDLLAHVAPSAADDDRFRAWWDEAGRQGASPGTARLLRGIVETSDVRDLLPSVCVPTLVVHRRDNRDSPLGQAHYLRDRIPGAELVVLGGADGLWWVGDGDAVLSAVEIFVHGSPVERDPDRVPGTLLMTDVVGSTAMAARLGDRAWRRLLEQHDRAVRRLLAEHSGTHLDDSGDGLLASFETPDPAVRCASAMHDVLAQLELPIRAGIHRGEVELRGERVAGLDVHVVARVCALAGPGEVLLSRTAADSLADDVPLDSRGLHTLRGVPEEVEVLAVRRGEA